MGVVVRFDVGEDLDLGVGLVDKTASLEHLGFDGADDTFGPRVVVRISPGGHALAEAGLLEKFTECDAPVLAAGSPVHQPPLCPSASSTVAVEDGVLGVGT